MSFTPSIGDIMLLSSLAWKIGQAFTSGRGGAPAEFQEVQNELTSLSTAINVLCDTLGEDDSILERADDGIKQGIVTILGSCQQARLLALPLTIRRSADHRLDARKLAVTRQSISRDCEAYCGRRTSSAQMENKLRSELQEDVVDDRRREHTRSTKHAANAHQLHDFDDGSYAKVRALAN